MSTKEPGPRWEVVGGSDKGGILVRAGKELASPQCSERLSTHAIIEQQELVGERLKYRVISGFGPEEGWVSIRLKEKVLVKLLEEKASRTISSENGSSKVTPSSEAGKFSSASAKGGGRRKAASAKVEVDVSKEEVEWTAWSLGRPSQEEDDDIREASARKILGSTDRPYAVLGLQPGASSSNVRRAYHMLALLHHPDKGGNERVFTAISDAYKRLTDAKDADTDGWRDLENQAVGPWPGHLDLGTKGVTAMLFDTFGAPPWESRRLYTGGYLDASIKCWELSQGEPGVVEKPPRLIGEIPLGGFVNDIAALSSFGLLTAQSAGMKPMPGESLRCWNMRKTPFKPLKRDMQAVANAAKLAAIEDGGGEDAERTSSGRSVLVAQAPESGDIESSEQDGDDYLAQSEMVYLHYRGVRAISLWPKPSHRESVPVYAATVSKDVLALSKIRSDGLGLHNPGSLFSINDPHELTDINCMQHERSDRLWTGDNGGTMKCWDITRSTKEDANILSMKTSCGWMSGMVMWPDAGCVAVSHSSGIAFLDMRAGKTIRQQYTKEKVEGIACPGQDSPFLFAGIGPELNQYDTRFWKDGINYVPKAVAQWSLGDSITSLATCITGKGHVLVAVGTLHGKVAAFDTT